MELKRFYGSKLGNQIILTDREYFHCVKVTRHKAGYSLICCTGDGFDYYCNISEIKGEIVYCDIEKVIKNDSEPKGKIVLCQALCKEFDFVVQKSVELGVTDIVPYVSERINIKKYSKERTENIILDAAKQCGRAILPCAYDLKDFNEILDAYKDFENKVFCYELERKNAIKSAINKLDGNTVLFVGSEGGFSEEEVCKAKDLGYNVVTLGRRILRVETAAISAITLLLDAVGDIC